MDSEAFRLHVSLGFDSEKHHKICEGLVYICKITGMTAHILVIMLQT